MPLTKKGKEVKNAMAKEYGNAGKIKGAEGKKAKKK